MSKLERAVQLLRETMGDENYVKFMSGERVYIGKFGGYSYFVKALSPTSVQLWRQSSYNSVRTGYIYDIDTAKLYDKLSAFIVNARHGRVNWGCGHMNVDLPETLPPSNVNFVSFIVDVTRHMLILPRKIYYIYYELFAGSRQMGYIASFMYSLLIFAMIVCILAEFSPTGSIERWTILAAAVPSTILCLHSAYITWKTEMLRRSR